MMRTTLLTTMLFFPVLMLQAAKAAYLDPNNLVAYYAFQVTQLTALHFPTSSDARVIADLKAGKPHSFPVDVVRVRLYSAPLPLPGESPSDALKLFIRHARITSAEYDYPSMYNNARTAKEREGVMRNMVWFATRFLHVRQAQKFHRVQVQVSAVKQYLQRVTHLSFDSGLIKINDTKIRDWLLAKVPGDEKTTLEWHLHDIIQQDAAAAQWI